MSEVAPVIEGKQKQKQKVKRKTPKMFKVVLINDDVTPFDYVIAVLYSVFDKSPQEAYQITQNVHQQGRGIAGVYTKQIAQTKIDQVLTANANFGFTLNLEMEEE